MHKTKRLNLKKVKKGLYEFIKHSSCTIIYVNNVLVVTGPNAQLRTLTTSRYVPPEGQYPFDNLIESTYIIRPAWGSAHHLVIPPHKTLEVPLFIPNRQPHPPSISQHRFPSDDLLSLTNHLDSVYPDPDLTRVSASQIEVHVIVG